jgi:hypothetical protein
MMDGIATEASRRGGNGTRWYDPHKLVIALAGTVFALVGSWGAVVFGMARSSETVNAIQDTRLKALEEGLKGMDMKLDRVLDRLHPPKEK